MASQSAKELIEELNKHRIEISKLRDSLNELDRQKESWFKKKEEFSKEIRDAIQKAKDNKAKKDSLTQEVKSLKPKRDDANKETSSKSGELEKLKKEKTALAKSLGIRDSPSKIRQQIEKIEFKIETEAISFDKEQQLMKKIKELKNLYEDASIVDEADKKLKNASDNIKKIKRDANETHELIQEKARQGQILHEEILKISSEIDKLKIEEEDSFKKFSELKKKFNEVNSQLKDKLRAMNDVKNSLDKISSEKKDRRRMQEESFLKSKEDAVNEKIKRREKLTTEDLLVFQKFGKG